MAASKINPSNLLTVNDLLADRMIRHALFLERLKAHEVEDILLFLDKKVLPDLEAKLERLIGAQLSANTQRLTQQALTESYALLHAGFARFRDRLNLKLTNIGVAEAKWVNRTVVRVVPFQITTRGVNLQTIHSALHSKPFEGRVLREWTNRMEAGLRHRIHQQIQLGMTAGESQPQIVRRLIGTKAKNYTNGVWETSRREANALVRTSINHISSQVRAAFAESNPDLIEGIQLLATLDARTTEICASLDGKVFAVHDSMYPPFHFKCRTVVTFVIVSKSQLGKTLGEIKTTRASKEYESLDKAMRGTPANTVNYPEWLRRQPLDVQQHVLGVGKAEIFRRGKLSFDKFVGSDLKPLSLKELLALEAKL